MTQSPNAPPRIALFATCLVDALYPETGASAVAVLERHGASVVFLEGQTCCGQPAFNTGHRDQARDVAERFLEVFGPALATGHVDAVVAPSGSCVAMVRTAFPVLFARATPARRRMVDLVAARTYELTEFLVDRLGVEDPGVQVTARLTYHPCCHLLRELGVDRQPRTLLGALQDADVVDLPDAEQCCGFGGLFALDNAPLSTAIGRRKIAAFEASGGEWLVMCDVSCATHVNGLLSRAGRPGRAVHIADLLAGRLPHVTAPGGPDAD